MQGDDAKGEIPVTVTVAADGRTVTTTTVAAETTTLTIVAADGTTVTTTVAAEQTTVAVVSVAVELAAKWAVLTAFCVAFAPALVVFIVSSFHVHCTPSSVVLRCVKLTDAEAAEKAALWVVLLFCAAIQTAVAVLAWLIPSRRRRIRIRHGLAYVALVVAILGHYLYYAGVRLVVAADPGYLFYRITCTLAIVVLAVGDVIVFIELLLAPGGQD